MHKVLLSCLGLTEGARKLDPKPGSLAFLDLEAKEQGSDGNEWSDVDSYRRHLVLAEKFVYEQANLCRALELLIDHPVATWDAMGVTTRAVAERAARISWLLDQSTSPRTRFKRALMLEFRSAYERQRSTASDVTHAEAQARVQASQERYDRLRSLIEIQFDPCHLSKGPKAWKIEGETFKTTTDELDDWATNNEQIAAGGGMYQNMSTVGHPQGLEASSGRVPGPGGKLQMKPEAVRQLINVSVGIFHISLSEYLTFQKGNFSQMRPLEEVIKEAFPAALVED